MAAPGGADQPELAEQIRLLREQNNLLVHKTCRQQGRPAARVQPQPERRRFLEPPTEADLDEQRLYLIPATLTRGPNSHRLPTDVAGAQGEPHLLNLTSEYIYLHAVEKGKKHDSTVLRILLSLLAYLEVLEFGLSAARAQALAAEALTENLVVAVEAQLRPVAAVEQEGAEEEARLLAAGQRAQLLERLRAAWYALLGRMAQRVVTIASYAGLFLPGRDLPASRIRAPPWGVNVFHVPQRAPSRACVEDIARLLAA
ncbi:CB domain-containing protein [Pseudoscourfieldia marina]